MAISEDESDVTESTKLPNETDTMVTNETDTMVTNKTDTMVTNETDTMVTKETDTMVTNKLLNLKELGMSKCNGAFMTDNPEIFNGKKNVAFNSDIKGYITKKTIPSKGSSR